MKEDKYNEVGIPTGVLERTETANTAMTGNATAKPMEECKYPRCEECVHYIGHYCAVPIVISKQIFLLTDEKLRSLEKRLTELENIVTDEILRSKERRIILLGSNPMVNAQGEELNYTWDDFLRKENE